MIKKFFGDDFIMYLVDGLPKTLSEAYVSLDALEGGYPK
jgi:hypothetical protein